VETSNKLRSSCAATRARVSRSRNLSHELREHLGASDVPLLQPVTWIRRGRERRRFPRNHVMVCLILSSRSGIQLSVLSDSVGGRHVGTSTVPPLIHGFASLLVVSWSRGKPNHVTQTHRTGCTLRQENARNLQFKSDAFHLVIF
jgi:hypothetical protein